jgi:hypothetical protein
MSARERTCADGLDKLIGRGITAITVGRPLGLLSNVIRAAESSSAGTTSSARGPASAATG